MNPCERHLYPSKPRLNKKNQGVADVGHNKLILVWIWQYCIYRLNKDSASNAHTYLTFVPTRLILYREFSSVSYTAVWLL